MGGFVYLRVRENQITLPNYKQFRKGLVMDIEYYFTNNQFRESLLFLFSAHGSRALLICEYADDVVQALLNGVQDMRLIRKTYHLDMRKLTFNGISNYTEIEGPAHKRHITLNGYNARKTIGDFVIQDIELIRKSMLSSFAISLDFGNLGRCSFDFTELEVERRLLWGTGSDPETGISQHVDAETQEPVDFYNAFSLPDA
jgi:hypothetical protein